MASFRNMHISHVGKKKTGFDTSLLFGNTVNALKNMWMFILCGRWRFKSEGGMILGWVEVGGGILGYKKEKPEKKNHPDNLWAFCLPMLSFACKICVEFFPAALDGALAVTVELQKNVCSQCWSIRWETPQLNPILYIHYVVSLFLSAYCSFWAPPNLKIYPFCSTCLPKRFSFNMAVKHSFHFVSIDLNIYQFSFIPSQLILPKVELHVCGVYLVLFFFFGFNFVFVF